MKNTPPLLAAICILTGCGDASDQQAQINALDSKLKALTTKESEDAQYAKDLTEDNRLISNYRFSVLSNRLDSITLPLDESRVFISVNPESSGYAAVSTHVGRLLISTASVETYLDGYKIHLLIGNPMDAQIDDLELVYLMPSATTNGVHFVTNDLEAVLRPGTWTPVSFICAPADPTELRNLAFRIDASHILLHDAPTK